MKRYKDILTIVLSGVVIFAAVLLMGLTIVQAVAGLVMVVALLIHVWIDFYKI